ncbi:MAG: class I SAM-dependent methyltransferase [Bdellovibrionaceae bacterium]|nr:class I SAM-dependent methyltransferase [Pseudobdellovibrionaceae bacterium]
MMKKNEVHWDNYSEEYQKKHGVQLNRIDFVWGVWSLPESELNILGDVKGKRVLEVGCGAAQLSIAIAKNGGLPTGLDISSKQLEYARKLMDQFQVHFDLIHSSADDIPSSDNSFDIVFCDHGAMTYSPTEKTLSEIHRVLDKGGVFAFNIQSPIHEICYNEKESKVESHLCKSYFELSPFEDDGLQYYQYTYSEWIKMFIKAGFKIIDLVELRAKEESKSTFDYAPKEWAIKYPTENIWILEK